MGTNRYALLIPTDEAAWDDSSEQDKQRVYARHAEFRAALAARGHTVLMTSELAHSRDTALVRPGSDGPTVTQGPYAESVEQLSGFYLVESNDRDDLVEVAGLLTDVETAIEVRAFGGNGDDHA
jgi:hypothetical protein